MCPHTHTHTRTLIQLFCGRPDIDLEDLQSKTEYKNGLSADSPSAVHFWRCMAEITTEEKAQFLRFCRGVSSAWWPLSCMDVWISSYMSSLSLTHTRAQASRIHADDVLCLSGMPDKPLDSFPHAQTCFFELKLPEYTDYEAFKAKFMTAIWTNTMDLD
jgi:hypothetical protein